MIFSGRLQVPGQMHVRCSEVRGRPRRLRQRLLPLIAPRGKHAQLKISTTKRCARSILFTQAETELYLILELGVQNYAIFMTN